MIGVNEREIFNRRVSPASLCDHFQLKNHFISAQAFLKENFRGKIAETKFENNVT
jgi:hypothetical protein